jgi:hypothetical protein
MVIVKRTYLSSMGITIMSSNKEIDYDPEILVSRPLIHIFRTSIFSLTNLNTVFESSKNFGRPTTAVPK